MTRTLLLAASIIAWTAPAQAGPAEDATAVVTTWLDKFNAGDAEALTNSLRTSGAARSPHNTGSPII